MTFNQWAAGLGLERPLRISLEAVWEKLSACDIPENEVTHLLDDVLDGIKEMNE